MNRGMQARRSLPQVRVRPMRRDGPPIRAVQVLAGAVMAACVLAVIGLGSLIVSLPLLLPAFRHDHIAAHRRLAFALPTQPNFLHAKIIYRLNIHRQHFVLKNRHDRRLVLKIHQRCLIRFRFHRKRDRRLRL